MIERFFHEVGKKAKEIVEVRSKHEVSSADYLATLKEDDRNKVQSLVAHLTAMEPFFNGPRIAIIAVGSTVKPETERHHDPKDIDIRILNSTVANSQQRESMIKEIRLVIREYLTALGLSFQEKDKTVSEFMNPVTITDNKTGKEAKILTSYVDWYNNDPSFFINYPEGLPIHISISGKDNPDTATYLQAERNSNNYFS